MSDFFSSKNIITHYQELTGGIVVKNLRISDNGSGELTIYGDVTITIKVLDLTTNGAANLTSLMMFTEQTISKKLMGGGYTGMNSYFEYDALKNAFNKNISRTYSIRYNFHFSVKVKKIATISQLRSNDFVLVVVDSIGYQFADQYGHIHRSGGLTDKAGGAAVVAYKSWQKDRYLATHEFFHTLDLDDIQDPNKRNRLMYHLGGNTGYALSDAERSYVIKFIAFLLNDLTKVYTNNKSLNTNFRLRRFLMDKQNGFKYDKSKL